MSVQRANEADNRADMAVYAAAQKNGHLFNLLRERTLAASNGYENREHLRPSKYGRTTGTLGTGDGSKKTVTLYYNSRPGYQLNLVREKK